MLQSGSLRWGTRSNIWVPMTYSRGLPWLICLYLGISILPPSGLPQDRALLVAISPGPGPTTAFGRRKLTSVDQRRRNAQPHMEGSMFQTMSILEQFREQRASVCEEEDGEKPDWQFTAVQGRGVYIWISGWGKFYKEVCAELGDTSVMQNKFEYVSSLKSREMYFSLTPSWPPWKWPKVICRLTVFATKSTFPTEEML